MNFKGLRIAASVAALLAASSASSALAADGTITFTGTVSSATCTINAGTPSITVALQTVSTSALAADGAVAGRTPFALTLTGCTPATGTVAAHFETGATTNATLKRLTNTGSATNVGVQILNRNQQVIQLGNAFATQNGSTAALATGAATLNYFAEYVATGAAATAGSVTTSTTYSIVYN